MSLRMPFNIEFIIFEVGFSIDYDIATLPCKSIVKLVQLIQFMFERFLQNLFYTVERIRVTLVKPEFRSN